MYSALLALAFGWVAVSRAAAEAPPIDSVRVYIHYHHADDRELVDDVADVLASLDYRVHDRRLVTQPSAGDVRFFHEPDRTAAVHVKAIVESVLATRGRGESLALLDRRGRFPDAGPGLVEIWVPPSRVAGRGRAGRHPE
jgi:hypothetical protein